MAISAKLVKELREKTGAGMMDCKKALEACDGDLEKSFDWLREKGIAKAAKKADRIAAEGLAAFTVAGDSAAMVEVNSETDFVAKNAEFQELVKTICDTVANNKPTTLEDALKIEIGKAKGQNWWCVMFPPLCFVDVTSGIVPEESKDTIKENLSQEEYDLLSKNTEAINFKFKIVETFQNISIKLAQS